MSKAVGNAVTRNRVKRRLRELAATTVSTYPQGLYIAVRALPASAGANWEELRADYRGALESSLKNLTVKINAAMLKTVGGGDYEPSSM